MTVLERLIRTRLSRIDTIKVRTAVNPLLWLSGLTLPICLAGMFALDDRAVRLALLAVSTLPLVATIVAYFLLLFRDPDRLQSEEYRIRLQALTILYTRGRSADIVDIANQRTRIEKARARPDGNDQP